MKKSVISFLLWILEMQKQEKNLTLTAFTVKPHFCFDYPVETEWGEVR